MTRCLVIVYFYVYRRRYEISFPIVLHVGDGAIGIAVLLRLYLDGPDSTTPFLPPSYLAVRRGQSSPGRVIGRKPMVIKRFRGGRRTSHGD